MSRTSIFVILLLLFFNISYAFATPRDVQYHWAGTEINTLLENGIMHGYEDGRFKPSKYITREEASVLFVSFAKYQGLISEDDLHIDNTIQIPDVKNQWSMKEIQYMYRTGIMTVYSDGLFKPQADMTRESLTSLIYKYDQYFNLPAVKPDESLSCPLIDIADSYAKEQIIELYKAGIISGYADNTFKPENNITRGEIAALLFKLTGLQPIEPTITLPEYNVINVPYISQVYPVSALVGCEGTSLLMGLHAKGYAANIGLKQFLDDMPRHKSNPAKGFVGSPYMPDRTKKTRTTIFPNILASWASKYGNVADFSGSSPEEIQAELLYGNPVVVYATLRWEEPFYRIYDIEGQYQRLLSNNHVVLACGYDRNTNRYYISDPYNIMDTSKEYKYWIDGNTFEKIYNVRKQAVVVQ